MRYSSADTTALVDRLIERSSADFKVSEPVPAAPVPVFIVGMHRSGTTLLERILAGHPDIAAAGELHDFSRQMFYATDHHADGELDETVVARSHAIDFGLVGQRYLAQGGWRAADKPYVTDKLPSNFLNLGFIARALPRAKLLHMVRDPMDTGLSNLRELYGDVCRYAYDQTELAHYHVQYRRLMAHWQDTLPGRILDVRYEDLVSRPEATTRRVLDYLGLSYKQGMLATDATNASVATASMSQARQPISQASVGAWRRYEKQLEPLRAALAENQR